MPRGNSECLCILLSKPPHAEFSLASGMLWEACYTGAKLSPEADGLGPKDPEVSPPPPIPHTSCH